MASSETNVPKYPMPPGLKEQERLTKQYAWKRSLWGDISPIPETVDVSTLSNVIDIAAGNCIWTLEVAFLPEVKERVPRPNSTEVARQINLYACDIDFGNFPAPEVLNDHGIQPLKQDATQAFPEHMHGTFDLVHMTLVVWVFSESQWKAALENCYKLLKPGGYLMLEETDPFIYTESRPPPAANGSGHDVKSLVDGSTWLHKANIIYEGFAHNNNTVTGLTYRLPSMLNDASFRITSFERVIVPIGKNCRTFKGLRGDDLSAFEEFSFENFRLIYDRFTLFLFQRGALENLKGISIKTEDERQALVHELSVGLTEDGGCGIMGRFLAIKH